MNYELIYKNLVDKRIACPPSGYSEKHHIVPRCIGGDDSKSNIVILTAREHFIAHSLLYKIYRTYPLLCAISMMCTDPHGNRIGNRLYEWHRKEMAERFSLRMKEYHKNNPHPKGMKNKKHSDEIKKQISESLRKLKTGNEIYRFSIDGEYIKSYDSISQAAKSVKGSASNIKYCADGKFQYAYKSRWSYERYPNFKDISPRKYVGNKNRIWITNGVESKTILISDEMPSGWHKGRAFKRKYEYNF